jgi:glycosyltransferase involved in cell wall biosynthesis
MEHKLIEAHPPDKSPAMDLSKVPARTTDEARVGFLGRFVEEKGIDVLLDAVPMVLQRLPNTRFLLAGDYSSVAGGSQYHLLQDRLKALEDHVEVLGPLSEEGLFPFYRSLDVFVLPSVNAYESFGMVQVEAMKSGVPVIASDLRGVRIPVRKTGNGCVVPPGNPRELANAIVEQITKKDSQGTEQIAQRAWAVFRNENNTAIFVNALNALNAER